MAIRFGKQVRVYAYYTGHRKLTYTVDRPKGVPLDVFLSELNTRTVKQADAEARRRFGLAGQDEKLDFVVIATTREEDELFKHRQTAEQAARVVKEQASPDGHPQMTLVLAGKPVVFPKAVTTLVQNGGRIVFQVEANDTLYLLEASDRAVSALFMVREPSVVVFEQSPGELFEVLPTGERLRYKLLPPGFSLFDAMMQQRRDTYGL